MRASSGLKGSCRSTGTGLIVPDGVRTGSRSRTPLRLRCSGQETHFDRPPCNLTLARQHSSGRCQWQVSPSEPVNSRGEAANPRSTTLHCAIVNANPTTDEMISVRSSLAARATPRSRLWCAGRKHHPCSLEVGAGLIEAGRGAVGLLARFRAWIESQNHTHRSAAPGMPTARPDMYIAQVNQPTVGTVGIRAAGKGFVRHGTIKAGRSAWRKSHYS